MSPFFYDELLALVLHFFSIDQEERGQTHSHRLNSSHIGTERKGFLFLVLL